MSFVHGGNQGRGQHILAGINLHGLEVSTPRAGAPGSTRHVAESNWFGSGKIIVQLHCGMQLPVLLVRNTGIELAILELLICPVSGTGSCTARHHELATTISMVINTGLLY
jgi:hypothetical protein